MKFIYNKNLIFSIITLFVVSVLVGIIFFLGRYSILSKFKNEFKRFYTGKTLGELLDDEKKKGVSLAYYDQKNIVKEINDFSWGVPNVPTPFVGHAPIPGKHNNAYINSMQFRSDKEVIMPKPSNVYRIFLTGGSTAYGSGAPHQNKTISGYLEKMLNEELSSSKNLKYEIFTMANSAWASTHERIVIENKLSELSPDMILSFSGNNDVHWGAAGRNVLWFRSYNDDFFFILLNKVYNLLGYSDLPNVTDIKNTSVLPNLVVDRLIKNVKLSSYVLNMKNVKYVFVLQPTLAVTKKPLTLREQKKINDKKQYFIDCYSFLDSSLKKLKMDNYYYINASNIFDEFKDKEDIFIDSYHFGDKGNDFIAKNLFEKIREIIKYD